MFNVWSPMVDHHSEWASIWIVTLLYGHDGYWIFVTWCHTLKCFVVVGLSFLLNFSLHSEIDEGLSWILMFIAAYGVLWHAVYRKPWLITRSLVMLFSFEQGVNVNCGANMEYLCYFKCKKVFFNVQCRFPKSVQIECLVYSFVDNAISVWLYWRLLV